MDKDLLEVEKIHYNELRSTTDQATLDQLEFAFLIDFTFESITIDGKNTLSKPLIANLLEKQIITSHLSEREQKEALNHQRAFEMVKRLVTSRTRLTEEVLKDLHEILVDGIFVGGRYRNVNVQLTNSIHQPPDYIKVYDRMRKYFYDVDNFRGTTIQKAAFAYAGLYKIHPFLEGNGRLARLVINYYLMFDGYLPITFSNEQQQDYLRFVDIFKEEKDLTPFANYVHQILLNTYEKAIETLER